MSNSFLARLADRLVLQPSTEPIDPEQRRCELIDGPAGNLEAWVVSSQRDVESEPEAIAIKFPGTAGRAERSGPHPFELWPNVQAEIWTINHHGYGGSDGKASLQHLASSCEAVWHHLANRFPGLPIFLTGNSLGCVSALYLSARFPASGILLRNPVPLHQMISTRPRYNCWNFGAAGMVARQIPSELDAVENARQTKCPALFIRSEMDRVIPGKYQQMISAAFAGEKNEFVIEGADHHHLIPDSQIDEYVELVGGLQVKWFASD